MTKRLYQQMIAFGSIHQAGESVQIAFNNALEPLAHGGAAAHAFEFRLGLDGYLTLTRLPAGWSKRKIVLEASSLSRRKSPVELPIGLPVNVTRWLGIDDGSIYDPTDPYNRIKMSGRGFAEGGITLVVVHRRLQLPDAEPPRPRITWRSL